MIWNVCSNIGEKWAYIDLKLSKKTYTLISTYKMNVKIFWIFFFSKFRHETVNFSYYLLPTPNLGSESFYLKKFFIIFLKINISIYPTSDVSFTYRCSILTHLTEITNGKLCHLRCNNIKTKSTETVNSGNVYANHIGLE